MILTNDTICDNQALGAVGFTVVGGGLLNLGTATVEDCTFSNNQVTGGGAYDAIGGSGGAAIDSFGGVAGGPGTGSKLTVANSTFCNNTASAAGGGYYFGLGGAIEVDGGLNAFDSTQIQPSTATITNSCILNNLATGGPNVIANGGGLCFFGGNVTLAGCTITGNRAVGGGGGDGITTGDSEAIGGGVENGLGTLNVSGCTITGNQAIGGNDTTISDADPTAGGAFGGAIQNNIGGVLNISNSVVADNIARGGATAVGPGSNAQGGGIENSTGFPDPPFPVATLMMSNCVVAGNSAIAGQGGPGTNPKLVNAQAGFAFGGGIDCSHNGSIAVISCSLITGNSAIGSAGGGHNNGGNAYGGGLAVGWGTLVDQTEGSQLTLINSVVTGNQAVGGQGGAHANGGNGFGGGLYVGATCSATVSDSRIESNQAIGGEEGKGKGGHDGLGIGGGVYNDGMFTDDLLTIIAHNLASTSHDNIFG